jgi:hypothetical protein
MKNSESFSVLFWANRAKANSNGQMPIYARVKVMHLNYGFISQFAYWLKTERKCGHMLAKNTIRTLFSQCFRETNLHLFFDGPVIEGSTNNQDTPYNEDLPLNSQSDHIELFSDSGSFELHGGRIWDIKSASGLN